jgi:toxin HigB-1
LYCPSELKKLPVHLATKLHDWVEDVEDRGLEEVRKIKGYHDEPLHGQRKGERSIRLSRGYRAIYRNAKNAIYFVFGSRR